MGSCYIILVDQNEAVRLARDNGERNREMARKVGPLKREHDWPPEVRS